MKTTLMVEYTTHFGPNIVLTLQPDRNRDNILDKEEQRIFLERVNALLVPNVVCKQGETPLQPREMERSLTFADESDFKKGLNSKFIWYIPLLKERTGDNNRLSIMDRNFSGGDMDGLSYFVTVLGDMGPVFLKGDGRELVLVTARDPDITGRGSSLSLPSAPGSGKDKNGATGEADVLKSFLSGSTDNIGLYLLGMLTAFFLGGFHALSPGHGKAMVAAYLVGSGGKITDAVRLGMVVTITHVLSVLILGMVAMILSHYTLSRDFIPWLGVVSGVLIFFTGYFLLARSALLGSHHHHHHDVTVSGNHSFKETVSLGVAGGLVPCPTGIIILLFAVSVDRIGTGLLLIVSFSLGLAAVLIIIGIMTVTASRGLARFDEGRGWIKKLPVLTSAIIMVLGIIVALNALFQAGIIRLNI